MTYDHLASVLSIGFFAVLAGGCTEEVSSEVPEPVGVATVDLTLAPTDARCAELTFDPDVGTTVVRRLPLAPQQTAVFSLTGLPTGAVTASERVFTVACNTIVATTAATWIADPVNVELQPGVPVTIQFALRRADASGEATVISDFPDARNLSVNEFAAGTTVYVATGPDDNVWFTTFDAIGRATTAGAITTFPISGTPLAWGIAAGGDGNLWFTNRGTPSGVGRITTSGAMTMFAVGGDPFGITSGPDGNIWFTEFGTNRIGRVTPAGSIVEFSTPTAASAPAGITTGPDRNLWFTEYSGNRIGRITPTGTITEFAVPTTASQPWGITAGPDGNLWFVELTGSKIGRITPTGVITEFTLPAPGSQPIGITSGPDGKLWFTEFTGGRFGSVTVTGTITEYQLPTGLGSRGITTGPDGKLWITGSVLASVGL